MRIAEVQRNTKETQIRVRVNLDGTGEARLATGIGFFDHMLDQIARHGLIDLEIDAKGDLHIDGHHTVEDVGITLGQAMAQAVGDKKGLRRYGHAYIPLDEALSRVVVDFSGRPGLHMRVDFRSGMVGALDTQLVYEFFQGFANHAGVTLHIDGHHTVEDVGITLGQAVAQAVGDKKGLTRYGHAYVPLDEALSRVVVDFSGRPGLHMDVKFRAGMIGAFDRGIVTYALGSRTYERMTNYGQWPVWLPDGRRLLFVSGGKAFYVVDRATRAVRKVFSVTRDVIGPPQLTRDGRAVYYSRRVTEADIWLVTLR